MKEKVTMAAIAKRLGVSTVTVSRALAGKDGVGGPMRASILKAAGELGYQPKSTAARSAPEGGTVGILISCRFIGRGHSFYWDLYERVLETLAEREMFGILEPVKREDEAGAVLPRILRSGRVQALLLIGQMEPGYRQALAAAGLPAVQLDAYHAGSPLDAVISDGYYGMYTVTSYLLRRGHRRIAYLGLVGSTTSITDRYFGYCRALQEWGVPLREDWVIPDRKENEKFPIPLPAEMPTAFACNCDAVAAKLLERLAAQGLRVPQDVSVAGFDGFLPSPVSPALTSYAVDMEAMVRASVDQLAARMAGACHPPELRIIPGHLVEGESVQSLV